MNQRIRELVGQAKFMAEETINKQISKNEELNAFAEKFAELIVAECIDCLKPLSRNHSMVGAAQDTIREHFGVE